HYDLPISYRPYVPLRVRRRPPRRSRRPLAAAIGIVAFALVAIVASRACAAVTPAAATSARGKVGGQQANRTPALASGACQQLAPTGHARGQTVFIDAGHGGPDPGVTGTTTSGATVKESAAAL